jgi:hypothetical protein
MFAIAAIGFRGGFRALETPSFVVAATVTLVLGLAIQTVVLTTYLAVFDRKVLMEIFRAWRPSLFAGFIGAFASQMWYLAFALETAAKVRTLALGPVCADSVAQPVQAEAGLAGGVRDRIDRARRYRSAQPIALAARYCRKRNRGCEEAFRRHDTHRSSLRRARRHRLQLARPH